MGSFSSITILRVLCSIKKETFSNKESSLISRRLTLPKKLYSVAQYLLDPFFSEYFVAQNRP
jgi:hypothetical protein